MNILYIIYFCNVDTLPDDLKAYTAWYFVVRYCFTHSSRLAAQVACLEHPGIAPPSADSQMCPSHEVQDEDLGKKAFQ